MGKDTFRILRNKSIAKFKFSAAIIGGIEQ